MPDCGAMSLVKESEKEIMTQMYNWLYNNQKTNLIKWDNATQNAFRIIDKGKLHEKYFLKLIITT